MSTGREIDAQQTLPLLLTDQQTAELIGISRRQVHRLRSTGDLPAPVQVPGCRMTRWRRADIEEFVEEL